MFSGRTLVVVVFASVLSVTGCTDSTRSPSSSSSSARGNSSTPAFSALTPVMPATLTPSTAKKETTRVADSIVGLVNQAEVVNVDDRSEIVPATDSAASLYGVYRTMTLSSTLDPVEQAKAMVALLQKAGWIVRQSRTPAGGYLVALTSNSDGAKAWFLLLGADATVAKQSVVTIQLASPDLPRK